MRAARTLICVAACLVALPAPARAARIDIDRATPLLRAGEPAQMRVRLSFTGERTCHLTFKRGRLTQTTEDVLTEHRYVTWRWRVPKAARSGRWTLTAECGAEAELTVRATRRLRLAGGFAGPRIAARRVNVFTSGDPLVVAFVERP
ncbi:MAG TPA: hypothetical protein VFY44_12860 [Thermoleophilaceae bacterium]|nr:hypothetical protein [Thermoleophilaceae bacterium]